MGMRETLQSHPAIVGVIAVIVLVICAATWIPRSTPGGTPTRWFLDMETGELVAHHVEGLQSPVTLPSGHEGVWAHVFSCGDCDDKSQRFIGFIEKFTNLPPSEGRSSDAPKAPPTGPPGFGGPGAQPEVPESVVASPDDREKWYDSLTPQGVALRNVRRNHPCPSGQFVKCSP
jgi:hypothetical protein